MLTRQFSGEDRRQKMLFMPGYRREHSSSPSTGTFSRQTMLSNDSYKHTVSRSPSSTTWPASGRAAAAIFSVNSTGSLNSSRAMLSTKVVSLYPG